MNNGALFVSVMTLCAVMGQAMSYYTLTLLSCDSTRYTDKQASLFFLLFLVICTTAHNNAKYINEALVFSICSEENKDALSVSCVLSQNRQ